MIRARNVSRAMSKQPRQRGGFGLAWLVVALTVVVAVAALALDVSLIGFAHQQQRSGCESAALAGAAELMDRNVLYPDRWKNDSAAERERAEQTAEQVVAAQSAAAALAGLNRVDGDPLELQMNWSNDPGGDVVAGWVEEPCVVGSPLDAWRGEGACNSLLAVSSRTAERGSPITLWLGSLVGVPEVGVQARARATVIQQVCGFRPVDNADVPMFPIAVLRDGEHGWLEQAFATPEAHRNDRFAVDYETGEIDSGPDGIPEITLSIPLGGRHGHAGRGRRNCAPLLIGPDARERFAGQVRYGLGRDDLSALDGEFSLDGDLRLPTDDALAAGLPGLLDVLKGTVRVWPLGSPVATGGAEGYDIEGFGGGTVVDCRIEGRKHKRCTIVVQAGLLHTCTALVRAGQAHNPWIGKLSLTQ